MTFHIAIIAVGRLKKKSAFFDLFENYTKRMQGKFTLIELEGHNQADELQKIKDKISPTQPLIIMDERGKSLPSVQFAKKLESIQLHKSGTMQFVIGGADGLDQDIRNQADLILSFGAQTWPHMMVRIMLVEQLYRAQQILANHPYHRE